MAEINPEKTLTLCVISSHNIELEAKAQCFFQACGGLIGSNKKTVKWHLPEPKNKDEQKAHPIHGEHAKISFEENLFYLEVTSNLSTIKRTDVLMEQHDEIASGDKVELRNGDYLSIGPYQTLAAIHDETLETMVAKLDERKAEAKKMTDEANQLIAEAEKQFEEVYEMEDKPESELPKEPVTPKTPEAEETAVPTIPENTHHLDGEAPKSLDPLELLGISDNSAPAEPFSTPEPNISEQLQAQPISPLSQPIQGGGFIPEDWHNLDDDCLGDEPFTVETPSAEANIPEQIQPTSAVPLAAPQQAASVTQSGDFNLLACRRIFELAGLDVNLVSMLEPEHALQSIALLLKSSLQGLLDNLSAMDQLQKQLRMQQATNQSNIFSQSLDGSDAIFNLLIKKTNQAPEFAINESSLNLTTHQKILPEAMQLAFSEFIKSQSPDVLEKEFEKTAKSNITDLALGKKRRYWDSYKAYYTQLSKDGTEAFQNHFAEAFNRAYDDLARKNK